MMKHNVDALLVNDGRIFAYGWAFDRSRPIRELALRLSLQDGETLLLPVTYGKERPDVAEAFPGEPQARRSGWMAYAGWDVSILRSVDLEGKLEGGTGFELPLAAPQLNGASADKRMHSLLRSLRLLWTARSSGQGQVRIADADLIAALQDARTAAGLEYLCLVIDHSMGGGANHFRKEWMQQRLATEPVALLFTFDVHGLSHAIELQASTGETLRLPCSGTLLHELATSGLVREVFLNDAVSFPRPAAVAQTLRTFVQGGASMTVAIHDYLSICPSPFLLNDESRYCGVPSMNECMRCLRANGNTFPAVQPPPDMPAWRATWGELLASAETLLCFSESSRRLMLRAYPTLDEARIRVVPHVVRPFPAQARVPLSGALHVGVVGAISLHKGAGILQALAREIAERAGSTRITVFGTLEGEASPEIVRVTGAYERDALPGLIEQSGANVFLMPSICPETFSYVTHELIGLGVPLACFDLGAPADSVGNYPRGRVLRQRGAAGLLQDLEVFHGEIQAASQQGTP
jgi:hypothetical protein